MFAAESLRGPARWLRAKRESLQNSTASRVLVVSNVASFGGGGVIGFRDVLLAIRAKRPDLDVVAVCPQRGDVVDDCARRGIRTKVAWTPWWAFGKWRRAPGLDVLVGALPYTLILIPGIFGAIRFLIRERPMLVLSNTMTIPSHAIAAKLLGIPHYWMVCEFGREDHQLWFLVGYRRTIRLINRLSDMVICNSEAVEKAMLAIAPTMTTSVIYPVVETPCATPRQRTLGEPMRAVLAGYFSHAKGQQLAVEAIAVAREAGVDIALTLVGSGSQTPLRMLARRLGVEDLVSIHGPAPDLGEYWSAGHVGLMCSQSEAFGRVTVEAMGAGLPVCGTSSGGTPEIISAGVNGMLSPAGDAHALAANLMALEADESLRSRLAAGAVETSQRFRRDRHDDELAAILGLS
ncbi:glycosyltransferase family 4 protein [Mycolicibacterium aichiense]|uniref:glycosyltransferase family 4 protein n=1 Tax=Mycolicibacterium aichiense TaxID=1799 RepID=UPI003D6701C0